MPDSCGLLEGKVLFLAGAGPQMGAATARIAAREGARVALVSRGEDTAPALAAEIRAQGGAATSAVSYSAEPFRCARSCEDRHMFDMKSSPAM